MTENEFIVSVTELVQRIVDTISKKEYRRLSTFAQIDLSWIELGQTQEDAFVGFGE